MKNKGLNIVIIREKCIDEVHRLNMLVCLKKNLHFSRNPSVISTVAPQRFCWRCVMMPLWPLLLFYLFHSKLLSHSPQPSPSSCTSLSATLTASLLLCPRCSVCQRKLMSCPPLARRLRTTPHLRRLSTSPRPRRLSHLSFLQPVCFVPPSAVNKSDKLLLRSMDFVGKGVNKNSGTQGRVGGGFFFFLMCQHLLENEWV